MNTRLAVGPTIASRSCYARIWTLRRLRLWLVSTLSDSLIELRIHERKANSPASGSRRFPIEAEMSWAASIENVIPLPP